MDVPVMPLDQVTVPLQPLAVNVAVLLVQDVGLAVIVGAEQVVGVDEQGAT